MLDWLSAEAQSSLTAEHPFFTLFIIVSEAVFIICARHIDMLPTPEQKFALDQLLMHTLQPLPFCAPHIRTEFINACKFQNESLVSAPALARAVSRMKALPTAATADIPVFCRIPDCLRHFKCAERFLAHVRADDRAVESDLNSICCICLQAIQSRCTLKAAGCCHQFCLACLLTWANITNTCPVCKRRFNAVLSEDDGREIQVPDRVPKDSESSDDDLLSGGTDPELDAVQCLVCHTAANEALLLMCDRYSSACCLYMHSPVH